MAGPKVAALEMPTRSRPGTLLIRADAGLKTGTGHVMRCLALAQAWARRGGQVTFFLNETLPALMERVDSEGFRVVPLPASTRPDDIQSVLNVGQEISGQQPCWTVLDGYAFTSTQQRLLLDAGFRVLVVDDYCQADSYPADIVVNQNIYATAEDYGQTYATRGAQTRLLLGTNFSLLRREFMPWAGWKREIPLTAARLLITLGGSDAANRSLDVLRALRSTTPDSARDFEIVLLVGGTAQPHDALEVEVAKINPKIRIVRNTFDMPGWMAWADIAVSGAGVTAYEMCFMGLPALLLVLADNQRPVAARLAELGLARQDRLDGNFEAPGFAAAVRELAASPLRSTMSQSARNRIDGLGADRVCAAMLGKQLRLRPLDSSDRDLLFRWANDPAIRAVSFHSEPISRARHDEWFKANLSDAYSVFHIGEDISGNPVGQVRYRLEGEHAKLSINVDPALKGQGWGRELLHFSTRSLLRDRPVKIIDAFVQPENRASLRLFEQAGFENLGSVEMDSRVAVHFVLRAPIAPVGFGTKARIGVISQPAYLPWLGYFDLIDQADSFVVLDSVQFEKQSWQQRNRIKTPLGLQWLTIPVAFRGRLEQRIDEVHIREPEFWKDHLRAIELNYRRTPYFETYFAELAGTLQESLTSPLLVDLNLRLIRWMMEKLRLHAQLHRSSEMQLSGKRTELLANILNSLGTSEYLSPIGAANYLLGEIDVMTERGIQIGFQNYEHPIYEQRFPPFRPYASALDLLFNEGPKSLEILRSGRRASHSPKEVAQSIPKPVGI